MSLLNGSETDDAATTLRALPGTRAYGTLDLKLEEPGITDEADVISAYCLLDIEDSDYNVMDTAEFVYGQDAD